MMANPMESSQRVYRLVHDRLHEFLPSCSINQLALAKSLNSIST